MGVATAGVVEAMACGTGLIGCVSACGDGVERGGGVTKEVVG